MESAADLDTADGSRIGGSGRHEPSGVHQRSDGNRRGECGGGTMSRFPLASQRVELERAGFTSESRKVLVDSLSRWCHDQCYFFRELLGGRYFSGM